MSTFRIFFNEKAAGLLVAQTSRGVDSEVRGVLEDSCRADFDAEGSKWGAERCQVSVTKVLSTPGNGFVADFHFNPAAMALIEYAAKYYNQDVPDRVKKMVEDAVSTSGSGWYRERCAITGVNELAAEAEM